MSSTMDKSKSRDYERVHNSKRSNNKDADLPDYVQTLVVKDSKGMEKILLLPKALDLDRPKRSRTAFAKWQLDALEAAFTANPYLVGEQRTALARRLGLSETQIKVWYQNRRTKQRKEGSTGLPGLLSDPPASTSIMMSGESSSTGMMPDSPPGEIQWTNSKHHTGRNEAGILQHPNAASLAFHHYFQNHQHEAYRHFVQHQQQHHQESLMLMSTRDSAPSSGIGIPYSKRC